MNSGYTYVKGRARFLWHLLTHAFTWGHRGHSGMRCSCGWGVTTRPEPVIDVNRCGHDTCAMPSIPGSEYCERCQRGLDLANQRWGVWCVTKPGWCCIQGGLVESDTTWSGSLERARAVYDFVRRLNPGHKYEIRAYEYRGPNPAAPNGVGWAARSDVVMMYPQPDLSEEEAEAVLDSLDDGRRH